MRHTLIHIPDVSVSFSSLPLISVVSLTSQLLVPHAIPGVWCACMLLHSLLSQGMYPFVYKIRSVTMLFTINFYIKKVKSTMTFKQNGTGITYLTSKLPLEIQNLESSKFYLSLHTKIFWYGDG